MKFTSTPDYEHPADSGRDNHYDVTVVATDSNNKRGEQHVDVIVKNVDEPPELTGPDTIDDFPENASASRQVARYAATDPERATVTLSLTAGGDEFTLASNGTVTFKESPDFEYQNRYNFTVSAMAGSHTVDRPVTVNIQNLEEQGTVTLSAVQPQEGTGVTAELEDGDDERNVTWQWYRTSSRGSSGTEIDGATSPTYIPVGDDVGRYLRAVATYDDPHGDDKTAFAVSVNRVQEAPPQPEPPVFPSTETGQRTIRENMPAGRNVGAPVTATDANNDRLTYSIPPSEFFEIVDSTGQLRTKVELDHETGPMRSVTVTATDPGGGTDSVNVTITVEDVDETPVVSGESTLEFEEGTGIDTPLATYSSTDPDQRGIDLELTGTDSEDFTLSSGGVLTFNAVPDFEEPADSGGNNDYRVTIEAHEQDDVTSVGRLRVTVRVTNVDEPGTVEANVVEPRVGQTLRLERAGRGRRRVRQGSGSGKRAFPTAHAARWTTRPSPTGRAYRGPAAAATPRRQMSRAIASGSPPSTTTGRARAGASSSSPPSQWRSGRSSTATRQRPEFRKTHPRAATSGSSGPGTPTAARRLPTPWEGVTPASSRLTLQPVN